jgi:hypothetical protein
MAQVPNKVIRTGIPLRGEHRILSYVMQPSPYTERWPCGCSITYPVYERFGFCVYERLRIQQLKIINFQGHYIKDYKRIMKLLWWMIKRLFCFITYHLFEPGVFCVACGKSLYLCERCGKIEKWP